MAHLRMYTSQIEAAEVVAFLLNKGIPAARVSDPFSAFGHASSRHNVVVDEADVQAAEEALKEMDNLPEVSPGDLELQAVPDLSLLDPSLAPRCPSCSTMLALAEPTCVCPGCGEACDVVELLVAKHGPEVLADCYPVVDVENDLTESTVVCPECRYSLKGLSSQGMCPECGVPYDKMEILRGQAGI